MNYESIKYSVRDRIATISLNRPDKLNAWTHLMEDELRSAMAQATTDEEVRVVVLTGEGRGFCAGADMNMLDATSASGADTRPARAAQPGLGAARPGRDGVRRRAARRRPDAGQRELAA